MIFSSQAPTRRPPVAPPSWGLRVARACAVLAVAAIAACGGSTTQYDTFRPGRLLVFGDETSVITPAGKNYSVNGLDANGGIACGGQPIWVQSLAALYGFGFPECAGSDSFNTNGRILATVGAKVDDVAAQIEAQVAAGGFRTSDLATVLIGANDIFELYAQYPALTEQVLLAQARERGRRAAQAVNRLVALGVKVIISDLPDLGLTPYARQQNTLTGDSNRSAVITRLTSAFNEQLGVNVVLDGRYVGLMQSQLRFQSIALALSAYGFSNNTDAVCTEALPECTVNTLVTDGSPTGYLWADDTHLSPGGHSQLASLAVDRARRNPF